jgi:hypothetical protein
MLPSQPNCFGVLKLYGTENYADWETHMRTNLEKLGLWSYIDGSANEPLLLSTNASHEDIKRALGYNERSHAAIRYVISQLGDGPYNTVIYKKGATIPPAKQLWEALRSQYQERGDKLRNGIFQKITSTKWDGANALDDHVEHFSRLMKRLNDITAADGLELLPEWTQISLLLQSINGVHEGVQKNVVDVLNAGNLRKKKFVEIAEDLTENGHLRRMLEILKV